MNVILQVRNDDEVSVTSIDRKLEELSRRLLIHPEDHDARAAMQQLLRWRTSNLVRLPSIEEQ